MAALESSSNNQRPGTVLTQEDQIPPALLEDAMDRFLEMKARPDCRETQDAFQAWLRHSDMHRQAWERVLKTWNLLGEVPPVHEHLWRGAKPLAAAEPPARRWKTWSAGAALALAACVVGFLVAPSLVLQWQADHVTETAESRTVTLEDGTTIEIGGDSAISAEITASARHVRLLKGEAFFDVAHDPSRPFTVDAGGVVVSVLGTAFDVELTKAETTVELARGSVTVSYSGQAHREHFELSPGEMATVAHDTGAVTRNAIALQDIGAWRGGKMFVNNVTVAAAAERLQRYHPAWITIPQSALAARRVTGLYDLEDPDRALQALVQPFGGEVRKVTPYGRVLTQF